MNGRNLFESRAIKTLDVKFADSCPGVFISHSRLDKEKARAVAQALEPSKVDYYFDENDEELQFADEQNDDLNVVRCIEHGIGVCSHLLGIITENTKRSSSVPYEIGRATGRSRRCAHLIDEKVQKLPSYIKAAEILKNRNELRNWLPVEVKEGSGRIIEITERVLAELDCPDFIPWERSLDDISFY